ncbi:MAG: hypothetical protein COV99_00855 [Bacteroidetes bacterium CG12_big_fil_rev_8_21_14_0_65_60_17]|nr:MAG: hypothetical protein COV99_00855 [Bacteroidetes bacterium CG12_big_fil_rev_8_21_14_0_65_60_17]
MPDKKRSILLGGLVSGLLSTSYLGFINVLCCLGVIAGALAAVWHYTSENQLSVKAGEGAGMGALSGLVGFIVGNLLTLVFMSLGIRHDLAINQYMLNAFGENMPPEQYDMMVAQIEKPFTIGGYLADSLLTLLLSALVVVAMGAAGGAIGARMFRKGGDVPSTDPLA